jgi:hypothetical protein
MGDAERSSILGLGDESGRRRILGCYCCLASQPVRLRHLAALVQCSLLTIHCLRISNPRVIDLSGKESARGRGVS